MPPRTSGSERSQAPTASVSMPPHGSVIRSSAARKWRRTGPRGRGCRARAARAGCGRGRPGGRTPVFGQPTCSSTRLLTAPPPLPARAPARVDDHPDRWSGTCRPSTPARPAGRDGPGRSAAARGEVGEVADDRVASTGQSPLMRAADDATHSCSAAGTTTGATPLSGIRVCSVRISAGQPSRDPDADDRRDPRPGSAWSAGHLHRRQPADPEVLGQAVEVGDDPDERPAPQRRTESSRSTRAGSWSRSRQKRSQSPHGLLPCSAKRCVQVWASSRRAGRRPPTTKRGAGRPRGGRDRAGSRAAVATTGSPTKPEASPPRPRHPPAHRVGAERDEVVGEQRARHPSSSWARPRRGRRAARRNRWSRRRSGAGRPCRDRRRARRAPGPRVECARGRRRHGAAALGRPGEVDPAQELELLRPGQRATRRLVAGAGVGPLQPRRRAPGRRWATQPCTDAAGRVALEGRSPVPQPTRGAAEPAGDRVGRGPVGGLRVISDNASRAAPSPSLARTRSGSFHFSSSAGRRGRRSSTSPTTSTTLP